MQIKTIKISEAQIERAKKLYDFKALNNSITEGEGNIYGAIGEIIIQDIFVEKGCQVKNENTFDYDLIINGKTIDVKTKRTTAFPKAEYNCSIAAYNTKQQCDYYFFIRVNENLKDAYLLGYIKKSDFFEKATFNKKDEIDKNGNGWKFKADCYNLKVSMLHSFAVV